MAIFPFKQVLLLLYHKINPSLTKLVRSRWLDISLIHFFLFMDLDLSRSIRTQKKNTPKIQSSWPHSWSWTHIHWSGKKTPRTRSQVGMYTVRVHGQILTEIQGCCNAPSTVILFCGSVVRSFLIRSTAKWKKNRKHL